MTTDDITTICEFIGEVQTRDELNVIERAITRKRQQLAAAEAEARANDPVEQARLAALRAEYEAEEAAEREQFTRREVARDRRLAEAPVIGMVTFTGIRPQYLNGLSVPCIGINPKSFKCNVPDTPEFKTWRGRMGIGVPRSAAKFEAVTP